MSQKIKNPMQEAKPLRRGHVGVASGSYCRDVPVRMDQPELAPEPQPEDFKPGRNPEEETHTPIEDITDRRFELISAVPGHTKV